MLGAELVLLGSPAVRRLLTRLAETMEDHAWHQFIAAAVPGTSPSPVLSDPNTFSLFGLQVHGNQYFSVLMILLGLFSYCLASRRAHSHDRVRLAEALRRSGRFRMPSVEGRRRGWTSTFTPYATVL